MGSRVEEISSVEIDGGEQFVSLPPDLAEKLLGGDFSSETIEQTQLATKAYFPYDKDSFGGVLFHSDGRGPEYPLFMPMEEDKDPLIQAIARIGVQYCYWKMFYEAIRKEEIDISEPFKMSILVFYKVEKEIYVRVNEFSLSYVAEKQGDKKPRFNRYVVGVNYGGDSDFWGPWNNKIFPMDVKVGGVLCYVERSALGLSEEEVDEAWKSWKNLHETFGIVLEEVVKRIIEKATDGKIDGISPEIREAISKLKNADKGSFARLGLIVRYLALEEGIRDEVVWRGVVDLFKNRIKEEISKEERKQIEDAAEKLASNLENLYVKAKKFCSQIYPYS